MKRKYILLAILFAVPIYALLILRLWDPRTIAHVPYRPPESSDVGRVSHGVAARIPIRLVTYKGDRLNGVTNLTCKISKDAGPFAVTFNSVIVGIDHYELIVTPAENTASVFVLKCSTPTFGAIPFEQIYFPEKPGV